MPSMEEGERGGIVGDGFHLHHPGLGDGGACGVEAYLGTHTLNSVSGPESL